MYIIWKIISFGVVNFLCENHQRAKSTLVVFWLIYLAKRLIFFKMNYINLERKDIIMIKKVAILANGGDVSGFNAVIRGIV